MPHYGEGAYWDDRYSHEAAPFDWYQGYASLGPLLERAFPDKAAKLLHVGAGTSRLQEEMVRLGGWQRIVNTDISSVAVRHMAELHSALPQLTYRVGDARDMPEFADASFAGVIDKGTLDAIVCGMEAPLHAARMLSEISRVLAPGGTLALITYGDPASRLVYLQLPALGWLVDVYIVGKQDLPGLLFERTALSAGGEGRTCIRGPFDSADHEAMEALNQLTDVHFVYLCNKLRAPTAGGVAAGAMAAGGMPAGGVPAGGDGSGADATCASGEQAAE